MLWSHSGLTPVMHSLWGCPEDVMVPNAAAQDRQAKIDFNMWFSSYGNCIDAQLSSLPNSTCWLLLLPKKPYMCSTVERTMLPVAQIKATLIIFTYIHTTVMLPNILLSVSAWLFHSNRFQLTSYLVVHRIRSQQPRVSGQCPGPSSIIVDMQGQGCGIRMFGFRSCFNLYDCLCFLSLTHLSLDIGHTLRQNPYKLGLLNKSSGTHRPACSYVNLSENIF